ncbi:MAG: hypothetical protein OXG44_06145, partial [Gammaproteobacteria bacterium]|nr:hypothetical protein [Gammaproteobacteria bacterium]
MNVTNQLVEVLEAGATAESLGLVSLSREECRALLELVAFKPAPDDGVDRTRAVILDEEATA